MRDKIDKLIHNSFFMEDITEELYFILRDYCYNNNISIQKGIEELDLLVFSPLLKDYRKSILREQKIKRLIDE